MLKSDTFHIPKEMDMSSLRKPKKIIVVDDDRDILELIKVTLEACGDMDISVTVTTDPNECLELLEREKYDLVISDQRMDVMDGIELLSKVKEIDPDIKRVLITAYSELELAMKAINLAQVDLYLEKPWSKDDIREKIRDLISQPPMSDISHMECGGYLFKEGTSEKLYRCGLERISSQNEGLIFSRLHPRVMASRLDGYSMGVKTYWLSKVNHEEAIDPVDLELIADMMIDYYQSDGKTVILDGVDTILSNNSFRRFEGFVDNIVDVACMEGGVFIIGLDPRTLSEGELARIERKMNASL